MPCLLLQIICEIIRLAQGAVDGAWEINQILRRSWIPTITVGMNTASGTASKEQCAHPSCNNLYKIDRIRRGKFCNNKKCPRHKEKTTTVTSPPTPVRAYPTTWHRILSTIRCTMSLMSSVYDGNEVEDNTTHHHLRNVNVVTMRRNNIYHLDHLMGLDESFIYLMFGFTQKEHVSQFRSGVLCAMALQLRQVMDELVIGGKAVWVDFEGDVPQNTATTTDEASSPPVDEQHNPETAFESVQGTRRDESHLLSDPIKEDEEENDEVGNKVGQASVGSSNSASSVDSEKSLIKQKATEVQEVPEDAEDGMLLYNIDTLSWGPPLYDQHHAPC